MTGLHTSTVRLKKESNIPFFKNCQTYTVLPTARQCKHMLIWFLIMHLFCLGAYLDAAPH